MKRKRKDLRYFYFTKKKRDIELNLKELPSNLKIACSSPEYLWKHRHRAP